MENSPRFETEVDEFLGSNLLYLPGAILDDGTIALNTRRAGLVVIDREGRLLHHIDEEKGLSTNQAYSIYQDREQGLWVALGNGLARIDFPSPLSYINRPAGMPEGPLSFGIHNEHVYVGSRDGIYLIDEKGSFERLDSPPLTIWHMTSTPEAVYASTDDGIVRIVDDEATFWNIAQEVGSDFYTGFSVHRSRLVPRILFLGKRDGLDVLTHAPNEADSWSLLGTIPGISNLVNTMTEPSPGHLVLGMEHGVIHLIYDEATVLHPEIKRLGATEGLPVGTVSGFIAANTQFYASTDGLFTYNQEEGLFERVDSLFPGLPTRDLSTYGSVKDGTNGELWITTRDGMYLATPGANGTYTTTAAPFLQASDWTIISSQVDPSGVVWLGGVDGLARFDPTRAKPYTSASSPLINRIRIGTDSLVAGGEGAPHLYQFPSKLAIRHHENTIRFDFQAPQFDLSSRIRYQSKLEGYDTDWSSFSMDASRTYTNLPGGFYRFHVRTQNAYGAISESSTFSFTVHPPWWYTWWAYAAYVLLFGLTILGATRINRRRIIARERLRAEREKGKSDRIHEQRITEGPHAPDPNAKPTRSRRKNGVSWPIDCRYSP